MRLCQCVWLRLCQCVWLWLCRCVWLRLCRCVCCALGGKVRRPVARFGRPAGAVMFGMLAAPMHGSGANPNLPQFDIVNLIKRLQLNVSCLWYGTSRWRNAIHSEKVEIGEHPSLRPKHPSNLTVCWRAHSRLWQYCHLLFAGSCSRHVMRISCGCLKGRRGASTNQTLQRLW